MKATEQYFTVVLFIVLYRVVQQLVVATQTKAIQQYFPVVLILVL